MKSENKRSVLVGIFILVGILLFVGGVLTLGGKQKRFVKTITLTAIFDNIGGLQNGSNIWYSGVKIGTVKKIKFTGNSQVEVTLNIEKESQKFIGRDSKAKLSSDGLIGNKIIEIYNGNPRNGIVEDGDQLHVEKALSTEEMMKTLQENNKNLLGITSDFKLLSLKIKRGEGTIGAFLTDSLLAEHFKSIISNLQTASSNTNNVTQQVSKFASKLNNKSGLANQLLTDTAVFKNLKTSVAELHNVTTSAALLSENLKNASSRLDDKNNAIGVLLNDPEVAAKLKGTLGNLETSTKKLDENMEALQHNFLLRGFFKKKAKQQLKDSLATSPK